MIRKVFLLTILILCFACHRADKKIYIKSVLYTTDKRIDWYFFSLLSNFSRSYLQLNTPEGNEVFFESFYLSNITIENDTLNIQLYNNDYKIDKSKLGNIKFIIDTSGGIWNQATSRLGRLLRKNIDYSIPHFQDSFCPLNECQQ